MAEDVIVCPHCRHSFELTAAMASAIEEGLRQRLAAEAQKRSRELDARERAINEQSLAVARSRETAEQEIAGRLAMERAKLADQIRQQLQQEAGLEIKLLKERLGDQATKLAEARQREEALLKKERDLDDRKQILDREVSEKLKAERTALVQAARKEALSQADLEMKALQEDLARNREKLAQAQEAEIALRKAKAGLEEEKREFELVKQQTLDAERAKIVDRVQKASAEEYRLKSAEKEKLIGDLQRQIDDLKRKVEQGSQQLQGEVQELDLEMTLRSAFPRDLMEPVAKGAFGGEVLHRVTGPLGNVLGTILWESKRTKAWSDAWLTKLRSDQREAKAEVAALVTAALPKGMETIGEQEGVWVSTVACAVPLARVLRYGLIEAATARQSSQGKQSKMEAVYRYLTGPNFRQRLEAVREAFEGMNSDLDAEKKVMQKQWAKREKQIEAMIANTVGMYGDLQGIAGAGMPNIDGFEPSGLLEAPPSPRSGLPA